MFQLQTSTDLVSWEFLERSEVSVALLWSKESIHQNTGQ